MGNKPSVGSQSKGQPSSSKEKEAPIIQKPLALLARFGSTSVTPGFSLFRDPNTGLIVFSSKEVKDDTVEASALISSSTFAELESFFRRFQIAHSRDIFPEKSDV